MSSKRQKNFLGAVALFVGTSVGAGIFGLPYAINQAGFVIGIIEMAALAVILLVVNLAYGEVVLRTPQKKQLIGYAELYLGRPGKYISTVALFLGTYGALIAYIIGVGTFLHAIFAGKFGGTPTVYSLLFFIVMAAVLFSGLKTVASTEKIMVTFGFLVASAMIILGLTEINIAHFSGFHPEKAFLPFGVILFALAAGSAIPTMREILDRDPRKLKKALLVGSLIPFLLYVGFTVMVLGVSGPHTTESAILGLGENLGNQVLIFGAIFGTLAMATSFLSLAFILSDSYQRDLKIGKTTAKILVLALPIIIVLLRAFTFIEIIGIGGAILGGTEGIIILMMHKRAKQFGKRKPEYTLRLPHFIGIGLVCIFILGIIYQLAAVSDFI